MEFIVQHPILWATIAAVCFIYVIVNQVRRMKQMDRDGSPQDFFKGITSMMLVVLVGSLSTFLFMLSMVVNVFQYMKIH